MSSLSGFPDRILSGSSRTIDSHRVTTGLPQVYHRVTRGLPQGCHRTAPEFPHSSYRVIIGRPRGVHSMTTGLQQVDHRLLGDLNVMQKWKTCLTLWHYQFKFPSISIKLFVSLITKVLIRVNSMINTSDNNNNTCFYFFIKSLLG